jgi:hypothetical protein
MLPRRAPRHGCPLASGQPPRNTRRRHPTASRDTGGSVTERERTARPGRAASRSGRRHRQHRGQSRLTTTVMSTSAHHDPLDIRHNYSAYPPTTVHLGAGRHAGSSNRSPSWRGARLSDWSEGGQAAASGQRRRRFRRPRDMWLSRSGSEIGSSLIGSPRMPRNLVGPGDLVTGRQLFRQPRHCFRRPRRRPCASCQDHDLRRPAPA